MTFPNPRHGDDRLPGRWGLKRILLIVAAIFILLLTINLLSRVHGDPGEKARLEPETRVETPSVIKEPPAEDAKR
ncbi:MAG: hypothetical protein Q7T86_04265 [Hyphomicrobiaceae bacterium]|nr:hypothetical protein [Hyphomicrobiaceae bacterium]